MRTRSSATPLARGAPIGGGALLSRERTRHHNDARQPGQKGTIHGWRGERVAERGRMDGGEWKKESADRGRG